MSALSWTAPVLARQVTEANVDELAEWCGGSAHASYWPDPDPRPKGLFAEMDAHVMAHQADAMNQGVTFVKEVITLSSATARMIADHREHERRHVEMLRLDREHPRHGPWPRMPAFVSVPDESEYGAVKAREGDWIVRVAVTPEDVLWHVLDDDDITAVRVTL